jgi:Arc/MetJ family transcription regulator
MARREPTKATTLRLDDELRAELAAVAKIEGRAVSDVVREAVGKHIATRGSNPEFQRRVKKKLEEDIATVKRLAERADDSGVGG